MACPRIMSVPVFRGATIIAIMPIIQKEIIVGQPPLYPWLVLVPRLIFLIAVIVVPIVVGIGVFDCSNAVIITRSLGILKERRLSKAILVSK